MHGTMFYDFLCAIKNNKIFSSGAYYKVTNGAIGTRQLEYLIRTTEQDLERARNYTKSEMLDVIQLHQGAIPYSY